MSNPNPNPMSQAPTVRDHLANQEYPGWSAPSGQVTPESLDPQEHRWRAAFDVVNNRLEVTRSMLKMSEDAKEAAFVAYRDCADENRLLRLALESAGIPVTMMPDLVDDLVAAIDADCAEWYDWDKTDLPFTPEETS